VLHPLHVASCSWPGAESNCRHHDFQSCALPTELPGPDQKKPPEPLWRGWEACGENRATGSPLPPTLAGSTYQSRSRNEYSASIAPYDLLNTGNAALGRRFSNNSGGRIRTCDLRVMSPTSYQTAPPRNRTEKLVDIRRRGQPIYHRADEGRSQWSHRSSRRPCVVTRSRTEAPSHQPSAPSSPAASAAARARSTASMSSSGVSGFCSVYFAPRASAMWS
jgi:hypothetical protein